MPENKAVTAAKGGSGSSTSTTQKGSDVPTADLMRVSPAPIQCPVSQLKIHQRAKKVPRMRNREWQEFLEDIRTHGVKEPIVVQVGGVVLDGRHRLEAAVQCGLETVPVVVVDLSAEEQIVWIVRSALLRRHLTDDQRAMLASEHKEALVKESKRTRAAEGGRAGGRGRPAAADSSGAGVARKQSGGSTKRESARQQAAKGFSVTEHGVRQADKLRGKEDLAEQVIDGTLTLKEAVAEADKRDGRERRPPPGHRVDSNPKPADDTLKTFLESGPGAIAELLWERLDRKAVRAVHTALGNRLRAASDEREDKDVPVEDPEERGSESEGDSDE
jgi:ParB-like chromosome segregation protein Spo0J